MECKPVKVASLVIVLSFAVPCLPVLGYELELARDGTTPYQVIIAETAAPQVAAVAEDFADHFQQITGAQIPIVTDEVARSEYEILIGPSRHLLELFPAIEWDKYEDEEYLIRTIDHSLILTGGRTRGTPNAVYTFLEDQLGCRWYTPDFSVIPRSPVLTIPALYIRRTPAFEARRMEIANAADSAWAARQRLNYVTADVRYANYGQTWDEFIADPRLAGCWTLAAPSWTGPSADAKFHTLGHRGQGGFLTEQDFKSHPEWFGMIDGQRSFDAQPCFSNPELPLVIAQRAKERLRQTIAKYGPEHKYLISISQGDYNNLCTCPQCQALYESFSYPARYRVDGRDWRPDWGITHIPNGWTGALMQFVNKVAAEIAKEFPDVRVHTYSYNWSLYPPIELSMQPNVVVDYANLSCCVYHTLGGCVFNEGHHAFGTDLERWCQKADHVWKWHYDMQGLFHPCPNLAHIGESFRQWRDVGVSGVFMRAFGEGGYNDFERIQHLRAYLYAKLLWDPDTDVDATIEEFVNAYYGPAAPEVLQYIQESQQPASYQGVWDKNMAKFAGFHQGPGRPNYLKPEVVRSWSTLFNKAEQKTAGNPTFAKRVAIARLAVDLPALLYLPVDDPVRTEAYKRFFATAEQVGVKSLFAEGRMELEEAREHFRTSQPLSM